MISKEETLAEKMIYIASLYSGTSMDEHRNHILAEKATATLLCNNLTSPP